MILNKRRLLIFTAVAGLLIAVWALIAPFLARRLIVERPLDRADAILVLSGSAAYKERTAKAAELYRKGVAPMVFITNDGERAAWDSGEQGNPPFVELEQRELLAGGVPPEAITVLPGVVTGTDIEAKALASEADKQRLSCVVIVTSAYHTRRALWTFDRIVAKKGVVIGIEHAPIGDRTPSLNWWWLSIRGWQMVGLEYVKSPVYWAYY